MSRHNDPFANRDESPEYRLTRGDRMGASASHIHRAVPYIIVAFLGFLVLFMKLGAPGPVAVPLAGALTGIVTWVGFRFATVIGEGFAHFVLPTGETTPYEHQFSQEHALAAKGDIAGALASFEAAIAVTPLTALTGVAVRIRAAELYMGKGGDPHRAAALLREVQRYPKVDHSRDIYVSNRLIDLLLGPLKQPSRALVELRRIADRYPDSNAATHARTAIAKIKRELEEAASHDSP